MTADMENSIQNGTSVPLWNIATPEEKQGFFDRNLNRLVGFIAKATGQPDPKTGAPAHSTQQLPQAPMPEANPMPDGLTGVQGVPTPQISHNTEASTAPASKQKSFFENLIAKTQNLLNKTSEISSNIVNKTQSIAGNISATTQNMANTVAEKTTAVSNTITNAPNMIAGQANTLIDKGMHMGGNLKETIQSNAQNLTSNPLGAVQNIGTQIGQGAQNIWNQVVQGTQNLWAQAMQQGQNLATNPLGAVQNIGQQGQNFANNPISSIQNVGTQVVDQSQHLITTWQLAQQTATIQANTPDTENPATTITSGDEATVSLPEANPVQQTVWETAESETPSSVVPTSLPTADPTPIISMPDTPNPQAPVQEEVKEEVKTPVNSENIFSSLQQGASNLFAQTKQLWSSTFANTKEFLESPVTKIDQITGAGGTTPEQLPPNNENTTTLDQLNPPQ